MRNLIKTFIGGGNNLFKEKRLVFIVDNNNNNKINFNAGDEFETKLDSSANDKLEGTLQLSNGTSSTFTVDKNGKIPKANFKEAIQAISNAAFETIAHVFVTAYPDRFKNNSINFSDGLNKTEANSLPPAEKTRMLNIVQDIESFALAQTETDLKIDINAIFKDYLSIIDKYNVANIVKENEVLGSKGRGMLKEEDNKNFKKLSNEYSAFFGKNGNIKATEGESGETIFTVGNTVYTFKTGIKTIEPIKNGDNTVGFLVIDGDGDISSFNKEGRGEYIESKALENALKKENGKSLVSEKDFNATYAFDKEGAKEKITSKGNKMLVGLALAGLFAKFFSAQNSGVSLSDEENQNNASKEAAVETSKYNNALKQDSLKDFKKELEKISGGTTDLLNKFIKGIDANGNKIILKGINLSSIDPKLLNKALKLSKTGAINLYKATLPDGFEIPNGFTGGINLYKATLPDGFEIPNGFTGGIDLRYARFKTKGKSVITIPASADVWNGADRESNNNNQSPKYQYTIGNSGFELTENLKESSDVSFNNAQAQNLDQLSRDGKKTLEELKTISGLTIEQKGNSENEFTLEKDGQNIEIIIDNDGLIKIETNSLNYDNFASISKYIKSAKDINSINAETIDLPELETAENITSIRAETINLPKLETVKKIAAHFAKTINLPELETAEYIYLRKANFLKIPKLKEIDMLFLSSQMNKLDINKKGLRIKTGYKKEKVNGGSLYGESVKVKGYTFTPNTKGAGGTLTKN